MAKVYGLYVGLVTALALSKYTLAEWNATEESANRTVSHCRLHGNGDNCTDSDQWGGHFSECPDSFRKYCVHGECRYVKDQQTASCRCQPGYEGSRCEYLSLPITDKQGIIVVCAIAGLVLLIILLVFICIFPRRKCRFCWRRRRRREEPRNGTEKLSMMDISTTQAGLTTDSTEPPQTDAVDGKVPQAILLSRAGLVPAS